MSDVLIEGSCLCGAVRYEITEAPGWAHSCHCSRCRKTTGSACAENLFAPLAALRYTAGEKHLQSFQPSDAVRFIHTFCEICGATLPSDNMALG